MNYGELKDQVLNISHRADYETDIPDWVELVESVMASRLRAVEMITLATLGESDRESDEIYNLPSGFLEDIQFKTPSGSSGVGLKKIGLEALYGYERSTRLWGYALVSDGTDAKQVAFIGTPAADVEIDARFFKRSILDTDNDSNTTLVLTNHPEIYVHGLLFYIYNKSQDLELAQGNLELFNTAIDVCNEQAGRYLGGTIAKPTYNLGNYGNINGGR